QVLLTQYVAVRRIRSPRSLGCAPHEHGLGIPLSEVGFPIRKFTDQSFFAAPRDLSQRSTSFIASQRQGIHRTPLRHLIALIINAHSPRQVTARTPLVEVETSKRAPSMNANVADGH